MVLKAVKYQNGTKPGDSRMKELWHNSLIFGQSAPPNTPVLNENTPTCITRVDSYVHLLKSPKCFKTRQKMGNYVKELDARRKCLLNEYDMLSVGAEKVRVQSPGGRLRTDDNLPEDVRCLLGRMWRRQQDGTSKQAEQTLRSVRDKLMDPKNLRRPTIKEREARDTTKKLNNVAIVENQKNGQSLKQTRKNASIKRFVNNTNTLTVTPIQEPLVEAIRIKRIPSRFTVHRIDEKQVNPRKPMVRMENSVTVTNKCSVAGDRTNHVRHVDVNYKSKLPYKCKEHLVSLKNLAEKSSLDKLRARSLHTPDNCRAVLEIANLGVPRVIRTAK